MRILGMSRALALCRRGDGGGRGGSAGHPKDAKKGPLAAASEGPGSLYRGGRYIESGTNWMTTPTCGISSIRVSIRVSAST